TAAVNRALAARGLAPLASTAIAAMVGDGIRMLLTRALAARSQHPAEADFAAFAADYAAHADDASRLFPGAAEALDTLAGAGWRLAVCTNKPEAPARALLAALGVLDRFEAIGAGDSFAVRKPDPAHLAATLSAAGAAASEAVMVGDHANDIAVARGLGVPAIFAGWGYGNPAMAEGAAAIAGSFAEIPALAARWRGN
ncbi:MAG: HAD-IA family hydrolase, partial [Acetobacteraceae bacterium]